MVIAEQEVWRQLLTVSPRGFVRWQPDIDIRAGMESRNNPVRYMAMCGNLRTLDAHAPTFTTDDLHQLAPDLYEATEGEITGVNGLLRLADKFPVSLSEPEEVLVVGAITPNSLLSTLAWCRENRWENAHVTLVDKSPVPIRSLQTMKEGGYFDWIGGVEFIEEDILHYQPSERPDLVVGDILNLWMVDAYQYPNLDKGSPYDNFERFLRWGRRIVDGEGWFLSRCMITPSSPDEYNPNLRFQKTAAERAKVITQQLGDLASGARVDAIEEMVEELFDDPPLTTFCGLNRVSKTFKATKTLSGKHAEEVFDRLHYRNFDTVHRIRVVDPNSGYVFQNYMCQ